MIDNLISDLMKKNRLIWSYTLKDMNFLIFRDFSGFFMNFYEFKINLFELNSFKEHFYFHLLMWQLTCHEKKSYATWRHDTTMCLIVSMCAHVRVRVCAHVCARVIKEKAPC